jgi:DNA-binding transcriptional ArsR family regulator
MINDEVVTQRLAALAHPVRLSIVRLLIQVGSGGLAAGQISEALNVPANAMTFHLQRLANVELVQARRHGQFMMYSASVETMVQLVSQIQAISAGETSTP